MWCVYILKSDTSNWHYLGSTNDLVRRLSEHNSGKVKSTKGYKPLRVVFSQTFASEIEARQYEKYLKHSRIAKESIIRSIR